MVQKNLKDIWNSFSEIFPELADTVFQGLKDPINCSPKEVNQVISYNIALLKGRLAHFHEKSPDMQIIAQQFMCDKKNFSDSQWDGLKKFHFDVNLFRQSLQEKLTLDAQNCDEPFYPDQEVVQAEKKYPKSKKNKVKKKVKISRDRWLQA